MKSMNINIITNAVRNIKCMVKLLILKIVYGEYLIQKYNHLNKNVLVLHSNFSLETQKIYFYKKKLVMIQ